MQKNQKNQDQYDAQNGQNTQQEFDSDNDQNFEQESQQNGSQITLKKTNENLKKEEFATNTSINQDRDNKTLVFDNVEAQVIVIKDTDKEEEKFVEHYWRFINLIIFIYQHMVGGLAMAAVSCIGTQVSEIFGISLELIILSSSMLLIGSVCTTFFNLFFMDKLGLKNVNIIFSAFNLVAAVFKLFLPNSISFLLVGMFLTGIGNIHLLNSHMLFFKNWFSPESTRHYFPLVTASGFLSIGFGSIIPFIFVDDSTRQYNTFLGQFRNSMYLYISMCGFSLLLSIFLFREKTPHLHKKNAEKPNFQSLMKEMKSLLKNKLFFKYTALIALGRGVLLSTFTNFNIFFSKLNFKQIDGSIVLIVFIIFGLIGTTLYNQVLIKVLSVKISLIASTALGYFNKYNCFSYCLDFV